MVQVATSLARDIICLPMGLSMGLPVNHRLTDYHLCLCVLGMIFTACYNDSMVLVVVIFITSHIDQLKVNIA